MGETLNEQASAAVSNRITPGTEVFLPPPVRIHRRRPGRFPGGSPPRAHAISLCHALCRSGEKCRRPNRRAKPSRVPGADDAALGIYFDLLVKEFLPESRGGRTRRDAYRQDPSQANLIQLTRVVERRLRISRCAGTAERLLSRRNNSWRGGSTTRVIG